MSNGITIALVVTEILTLFYAYWSTCRNTNKRKTIINRARTIEADLEHVDNMVLFYSPVFHFVQGKVKAAVNAMEKDDDDRASEYFTDVLLLTGPNWKVINLMRQNLPKIIFTKIQENYGKFGYFMD